jgi:hypothetical protein
MFNLNENIRAWGQRLAETEALTATDIQELETHLRISVAELNSKGLSEQESFWLAAHRLGNAESLAAEYASENPAILWGRRLCWMLLGYLVLFMVFSGLNIAENLAAIAAAAAGWSGITMFVSASVTKLLLCGLCLYGLCLLIRSRGSIIRHAAFGWLRNHLALGMTLGIIGSWLLANLTRMLTYRLADLQQLGNFSLYSICFQFGISLLFPLAALAILVRLRRQNQHSPC